MKRFFCFTEVESFDSPNKSSISSFLVESFTFSITVSSFNNSATLVFAVKKKFFTTENFRLGAVLGADFSWAGDNGKTALMSQKGTIEEENILYSKTPNTSYFLGFDAYSPTSTLGFMTGVSINLQEYSIKNIVWDNIGAR